MRYSRKNYLHKFTGCDRWVILPPVERLLGTGFLGMLLAGFWLVAIVTGNRIELTPHLKGRAQYYTLKIQLVKGARILMVL